MIEAAFLLQAFAAGVLAFFAPCTVAMLPAFLGYYLGREEPHVSARSSPRWRPFAALPGVLLLSYGGWQILQRQQGVAELTGFELPAMLAGVGLLAFGLFALAPAEVRRGVLLGLITTAGILTAFLAIGLPFSALSGVLRFQDLFLVVVGVAVALVALGIATLAGVDLGIRLPIRAPEGRRRADFFLFGIGYGIVSLGCNLPIFAVVLLAPLVAGDTLASLAGFLAYAGGKGVLMVTASVGAATSKGLTRQRIAAVLPHVRRATGAVLVLAGGYILWYWWSVLRLTAA